MSDRFVDVNDLQKNYNSLKAVDHLSLYINKGEVFGLLGPNGAGKTTTIEIMEGLRKPDGGSVSINGFHPHKDAYKLKEIIGVQLQASAMEEHIRAGEALSLFASFYQKSLDVNELLEMVGLNEKKRAYYSKLSGGQKQRLSLAIALVNDPQMVFLDEPTTGLDAQARRGIWDVIMRLKAEQRTVLLTTHYIEEAENLCDRVAIIDHGKIIAEGSPSDLIKDSGISHKIYFQTVNSFGNEFIKKLSEKYGKIEKEDNIYNMKSENAGKPLSELIKYIDQDNNELVDLRLLRPSLEDVFIELTGRKIRD